MVSYFGWGGASSAQETSKIENKNTGLGGLNEPAADGSKYQAMLDQSFKFGSKEIPGKHVFLARRYVFGMVTPYPVTIGHVIICP